MTTELELTEGVENKRFMSIIAPSIVSVQRGALELQGFDAAYLERLRSGHSETEKHFVSYFGTLILIKLRSRFRSRQFVDDVRQETFLRVLRAVRTPKGIRDPERLGPFVNSVCNNVAFEFLRSEGRHRPTAEEPDPPANDADCDPEAALITEERKAQVRRTLDELSERDRRLLRALFLEELDKDEVCEQFGVDRNYLRVLLHRAKAQFRAHCVEQQGW